MLADPTGAGAVSGSGIYLVDSQQQIAAIPSSGWVFVNWSGRRTDNLLMLTIPLGSVTIHSAIRRGHEQRQADRHPVHNGRHCPRQYHRVIRNRVCRPGEQRLADLDRP